MNDTTELTQKEIDEYIRHAHGDFSYVQKMTKQFPDLVHAVDSYGDETAIGAATHMGERKIVQYLLDAGAPLDISTAAMMGWRDKVADFLAKDPTLAKRKGVHSYALLYFVAQSGDTEMANMVMAYGGSEGMKYPLNPRNDPYIHAAIKSGHLEMTGWFLRHDIDLNARDYNDSTPLEAAVESGNSEIAELLRQHMGVDTLPECGSCGQRGYRVVSGREGNRWKAHTTFYKCHSCDGDMGQQSFSA
ncbi:MAG: ankyrin repeat domain-containing protein [Chloroflexota bacterium]